MIKNKINLLFVTGLTLISIFLAGCSQNTETNKAKTSNNNQSQTTLNTNFSVNNEISDNSPNSSSANAGNVPAEVAANNSDKFSGEKQTSNSSVKAPTRVIGSGGDDLSLFTQVRGALSAEQEFVNIVIDVKAGNVTLSGNVSSKEQKAKAEQIAQKIKGVKSVKNNLTVSS